MPRPVAHLLIAFALAAALSACGRAGPPLKPSQAAAKQAKANGEPVPAAPTPNRANPDKSFILDGLL